MRLNNKAKAGTPGEHMLRPDRLARLLAAPAIAFATIAVAAPNLGDPHLDVLPRTADEAARIRDVTQPPQDFTAPEPFEDKPAGAATVRARSDTNAFSLSSANMPFEREMQFKVGNGLFRKVWVSSPASTLASDGLGPLFNARSCQRCHLKDGRGHPPDGPDDSADYFPEDITYDQFARASYTLCSRSADGTVDRQAITSGVPGKHNGYNSLAAAAAADCLGIDRKYTAAALAGYT